MSILFRDVFEIYRDTLEGIKQQTLAPEFFAAFETFPRDHVVIARGVEAAFGFKINTYFCDFYEGTDVPYDKRDFFSFYEYSPPNEIAIYLNSNKMSDGRNLMSPVTVRFVFLKEVFNAVIRKSALARGREYPDTIDFPAFYSSHLDWLVERFSIYDFGDSEYSPAVSYENAAELLALMFLVDIGELYDARRSLYIRAKDVWQIENGMIGSPPTSDTANMRFAQFPYQQFATRFGVSFRHILLFVKTDFILKIIDGFKQIIPDTKQFFEIATALYDNLVDQMRLWSSESGIVIAESGQLELNKLFIEVDARHESNEINQNKAEEGLKTLLEQARNHSNGVTIDAGAIKKALDFLCPLFPFCE
jgi:hypothetical protein